jgi:uncharacterized protein (TIGR02722 family)
MKNLLILASLLFIGSLALSSCSRSVKRIDVDEQRDLSGRWNDTDSRLTAEEITDEALMGDWLSAFRDRNRGEKPTVIVGFVLNKSHEHIDAETFVKDIEKSFIGSNRVRLVQGGKKREELRAERADQQENSSRSTMKRWGMEIGADYIMQGSINSIVDAYRKQKVVYYQIDLELTDMETNEIVWIGDKKIKKYIKN